MTDGLAGILGHDVQDEVTKGGLHCGRRELGDRDFDREGFGEPNLEEVLLRPCRRLEDLRLERCGVRPEGLPERLRRVFAPGDLPHVLENLLTPAIGGGDQRVHDAPASGRVFRTHAGGQGLGRLAVLDQPPQRNLLGVALADDHPVLVDGQADRQGSNAAATPGPFRPWATPRRCAPASSGSTSQEGCRRSPRRGRSRRAGSAACG